MGKRQNDPQSLEELLDLLKTESAKRRRLSQWTLGTFCALILFSMTILVVTWIARKEFPSDLTSTLGSFSCLVTAGAAMSAPHRRALALAKNNPDPRLTGYFFEALDAEEKDVRAMAREALAERLPTLTREHYLALRDCERIAFAKSLVTADDAAYLRQAVAAAGRCSGAESIRYLEGASQRSLPKKNAAEFEKVRTSAKFALADVRIRLAKEAIDRTEAETEAIRVRTAQEIPLDLQNRA